MTKTKTYKYGPHYMKTYFKPAGNGFEVGMVCEGRHYFMGNFVHKSEANRWWGDLNHELKSFSKRYWASPETNFTWYCNFLSKHLYFCYYNFLDKVFTKHNKTYSRAYTKEARKYKKMQPRFDRTEKYNFYTKAA